MNVYFARSLRGENGDGQAELYDHITDAIAKLGHRTQFQLQVRVRKEWFDLDDQYIYARDLDWIDQCHVLVAEVSWVSHGVGFEIAYALKARNIPVLLLAKANAKVSAMLTGIRPSVMYYYADLNDLDRGLNFFLTIKQHDFDAANNVQPSA